MHLAFYFCCLLLNHSKKATIKVTLYLTIRLLYCPLYHVQVLIPPQAVLQTIKLHIKDIYYQF